MGNNRISIWAALSLTMLAPSVWAQPAPSPLASVALPVGPYIPSGQPLELKLDEAVALALRYNRHVRSAYLQRTVQRFDLRIAERAFVPRGEIGTEIAQRRTDGRVFDEIRAGVRVVGYAIGRAGRLRVVPVRNQEWPRP